MAKKTNYTAIIALALFFIGVVFVSMFNTGFALGANNVLKYFNVTVTVSGNTAPNITGIAITSATPNEANTVTAYILMNITDINGYNTVNLASTYVNITLNGDLVQSTGCVEYSAWTIEGVQQLGVNCTVTFQYYQEPGNWNISGYTEDDYATPGADADVNASTFTYNTLWAFRLEKNEITFNGGASDNLSASNNPQIMNNTGNGYFANVDITAQQLDGPGAYTIGPGNFTANTVDAWGVTLESTKTISGLTLARTQTKDVYLWLNIPAVGNGQYNSTAEWIIEAYN